MYIILSLKKIIRWKLKIQNKIITRLDVSYLMSGMEANKIKNKVSEVEHIIFNKDFVFDKLYLSQLKFENILVLLRPNLVDLAECVACFSQKLHGTFRRSTCYYKHSRTLDLKRAKDGRGIPKNHANI